MERREEYNCRAIDYSKDPQFDSYFPTVLSQIALFDKTVDLSEKSTYNTRSRQLLKLMKEANAEIEKAIPQWGWLKIQKDGNIAAHVFRMLHCVLNDPEYRVASARVQNILKWTTLLHDIAKKPGPPKPPDKKPEENKKEEEKEIKKVEEKKEAKKTADEMTPAEKDAAHPYTSGIEALKILKKIYRVKEICPHCNSEIRKLNQMIRDSIRKGKTLNLDRIEPILEKAGKLFRKDTFIFTVLKLTIMHQSMPPPPNLGFNYPQFLSKEQIVRICDKEYVKLLKIIVINDLVNYCLHIPERKKKFFAAFTNHFDNILT